MLRLFVNSQEVFNEITSEFIPVKGTELLLEHSLLSLKKWEEKWHVPFLGEAGLFDQKEKTQEQIVDYIRCMTINQVQDPAVYVCLTTDDYTKIFDYISNPMTATWFSDDKDPNRQISPFSKRVVTSELIYYWMIKLQIPVEFQKWHLNQLITLIRVINEEDSASSRKMSKNQQLERYARLNKQRRAGRKG